MCVDVGSVAEVLTECKGDVHRCEWLRGIHLTKTIVRSIVY